MIFGYKIGENWQKIYFFEKNAQISIFLGPDAENLGGH